MMKKIGIYYILGILIMAMGISLIILSDLGAGSWDALYTGLANYYGLTVGTWSIIVGVTLLLCNAYLEKRKPRVTSFISAFLIGWAIDFYLIVVFHSWKFSLWWEKGSILFIGIILMSAGIAMYLFSGWAIDPIDELMMALNNRLGWSIKKARIITELTATGMAYLVYGPVGIGTLLVAFLLGPFIQLFHTFILKIENK